ncbi:hypothetical protein D3C86_1869010 [compost metagenome]
MFDVEIGYPYSLQAHLIVTKRLSGPTPVPIPLQNEHVAALHPTVAVFFYRPDVRLHRCAYTLL